MCLEVEPVRCYIATEGTFLTVTGGVAATMHVEECTVAEHRATRAHKRHLSLTQISQDLLVGEIVQQVHEVCFGTVTTTGSSVGHWHSDVSLNAHTHTQCQVHFNCSKMRRQYGVDLHISQKTAS